MIEEKNKVENLQTIKDYEGAFGELSVPENWNKASGRVSQKGKKLI